ncbi:hypothetical protein [Pseudomonas sp. JUb42]|jgi:hypothetical protein|uniref:hypothetical protein n=1 Tax=Pseudomonas sp. JUb42 TaxID=2940611 RepID=UPI002169C849
MTYLSRQIAFAATYVTIAGGLWVASQWWEKSLATNLSAPVISPGGCYRVETLKPFWALPSLLQPVQDPNEEGSTKWFQLWGYPGFYKLYDHRSGKLIGMSSVYDLQYTSGPLYWGSKSFPEVSAGAIYIGPNVPDCIGDRPMPRNSAN